jgi:hypothetical protein
VDFLITNIGWGDQNAAVIGYIVAPDGSTYKFDNARQEGTWQLSSDRLRFQVGPNILDLHEPQHQFVVDKKRVRLDLRFRSDGPAIWSEALTQSGYAVDLLAAAVPVDGTLWMRGMLNPITVRGTLAATHSWMQEAGASLLLRRLEFFALQENCPLYGVDLTTPQGAHWRWIVIKQQEKRLYESDSFELLFGKESNTEKDPGYVIPDELQLKSTTLDGHVRLEREVLRNDPFANLPGPVRFLASVTLSLHPRRVWARSSFDLMLSLNHSPVSVSLPPAATSVPTEQRGVGVTAVTFLNPLPESLKIKEQMSLSYREGQSQQMGSSPH